MDSTVTNWAFGFGGWLGVLGSTYMLLNVPHTYTFSLVLLSPWLGGISMYLLMYMTYSWIRVSAQIATAMTEYEIIMALLTSVVGVMVVAIGRLIIDMERGHKTPAELAAAESIAAPATSAETQTTETTEVSDSESDTEETANEETDAENEETVEDVENEENAEETDDESGDSATGSGEESDDESGDSATGSGEESDDEESTEVTNDSVNRAHIEETSFENINTPQLNGIPNTSPIPKLPDI